MNKNVNSYFTFDIMKQKNMKINSLKLKCFENIFSENFPKLIKSSRKIKHFVSKIFHGSRGGILQYYEALLIFFNICQFPNANEKYCQHLFGTSSNTIFH